MAKGFVASPPIECRDATVKTGTEIVVWTHGRHSFRHFPPCRDVSCGGWRSWWGRRSKLAHIWQEYFEATGATLTDQSYVLCPIRLSADACA